mgnify:CR=1 FL=1
MNQEELSQRLKKESEHYAVQAVLDAAEMQKSVVPEMKERYQRSAAINCAAVVMFSIMSKLLNGEITIDELKSNR